MKKAALITIALLVAASLTYAMLLFTPLGGTLKGKLTDAKSGDAILGATIIAYIDKEQKGGAATDLDGNYTLNLPAGTYRLEIKSLGYKLKTIENVTVADGTVQTNDIKLEADSKELGMVVVSDKTTSTKSVAKTMAIEESAPSFTSPSSDYSVAPTSTHSVGTVTVSEGKYSKVDRGDVKKSPSKSSTSVTKESAKSKEKIKGKSERFDVDKETKKDVEVVREPDTRAGQLTAGEWSDNRNWAFYADVRKKGDWKHMEDLWGFDLNKRYYVKITSGGKAQNDVPVVLKDKKGTVLFEGRSDNQGNCYLFAGMFAKGDADGATIEVATAGGVKSIPAPDAGNTRPASIDITRAAKPANKLDVMFMIDATGSMGDEINYLKEELSDVIRRVKATSEQSVDIRVSANVYRDRGDEYVVRSFPFTTDMGKVLGDLSAQSAGGGGDFEEAVEEGLDDAINKHEWSTDATARLLFLVLDAPPHNTPENKEKIQKAVANAAKKGIRIIPVASSGVNKDTEFLMRYLSIATGGTYTFLTDHSGIGNSHIEPTIGKYDVEYLNNLMVRLINAYLTTES